MRPHRQYGQAGGPGERRSGSLCMSFPGARSQGIIKPLWRHGPKVALSPLPSMGARGIGFLSRLFGLISAPCLQAKVNFMPGQGVFMLQGDGRREGGIAVVGNPAAPLWRWVNSSKISTVNWAKQTVHCRDSSTLHWCCLLMLTFWIKGGTSLQHETTVARTQNMCRCISQKDTVMSLNKLKLILQI